MLGARLSRISRVFLVLIVAVISFIEHSSVTRAATYNGPVEDIAHRVVASVPGTILDFDLNRILYSKGGVLYIKKLAASTNDIMLPTTTATKGALTDNGAIYVENSVLYAWSEEGTVHEITNNLGQLFQKSRNYVTFSTKVPQSTSFQIWLFHLSDNSYYNVSELNQYDSKVDDARVSNDGHLMYRNAVDDYLIAYHNGVTNKTPHKLSRNSYQDFYDGFQIIYSEQENHEYDSWYLKRYIDGISQHLVWYRQIPYAFAGNNGWTAYRSESEGLVIYSPEGTKYTYPIEASAPDTHILQISDTGDVILETGIGSSPKHWFIRPGSEKVYMSDNLSYDIQLFLRTPFWKLEDGKYYRFEDGTLYEFVPNFYVPVESISLSETPLNLRVGQTAKLDLIFHPANASFKSSLGLEWHSSDSRIADVIPYYHDVRGISPGTAQITVTSPSGHLKAAQTVNVTGTKGIVGLGSAAYTRDLVQWMDEGNVYVDVPVYRTDGSDGELRVFYTTRADTAKENSDFDLATGSITFKDGQTSATIRIFLKDDSIKESLESFSLKLEGSAENIYEPGSAMFFVIRDND
ncbi:Calx-beta domain-containing protein [Paenibacillus chartarius]|uniref:Calx-beta domain-containing protein n=1 Tax=Paenibacillus chartarius TaxID=747481 RepID=A0ABV6DUA2_9BACL